MRWLPLLLLCGCDPYAGWVPMHYAFPWGVTDDQVLEPYEEVRWEAGPWDPVTEPVNNGLYVQKALLHRPGTPTEAQYHWGLMRPSIPVLRPEELTLSFAGDILHTGPVPTDFTGAAHLLDGELRVGNLETPVAPSVQVGEGPPGVPLFNAPSEILDDIPFDVLQLNNNHTLDAGDAGIEETIAELEARELIGIGIDGSVAAFDLGEGTILALVSYTWGVNQPGTPTSHDLGTVPFGEPGRVPLGRIESDLQFLRDEGVGLIVVLVHWGYEYEYYPDPHFMRVARRMVRAGADLVVGQGSHTAQTAEWCTVNVPASKPGIGTCSLRTDDGQPRYAGIFYGLGNFGTDQPTLPLQVGIVGHVNIAPDFGVYGMAWEGVASVSDDENNQFVVPLAELLDDEAYAEEDARLNQHLGTSWKLVR